MAQAEANLRAALVPDKVAKSCCNVRSLYIPAILPKEAMQENHNVDGAHVVRPDHEIVAAEMVSDLLLPAGLVPPHHRSFD